ncbi:MAG TPA: hypothetical protein PLJ00_11040 [Chitinophagales bacterium]|nr:hypothetical protein [Chitinophagales bacterium]HRG28416.1 hypothetical protein [Chitinophagales bacterium]HRG87012.1 hypothetical protein [Chitinophagales bacterium]HRH53733.1 hypothetical protein [Chitinophagales bacterium]
MNSKINKRQLFPVVVAYCLLLFCYAFQICYFQNQTFNSDSFPEDQYQHQGFAEAIGAVANTERLQIAGKFNSITPFKTIIESVQKIEAENKGYTCSLFNQYTFYTNYLILRLLQSAIIFPFHYFW